MAVHILEETVSRYATVLLPVAHSSGSRRVESHGVVGATTVVDQRRIEVRKACRQGCSYQLFEVTADDAGVVEEGEACVLNRSTGGVLLVMGRPLAVGQLVEVHIAASRWIRSASVFDVRWVKPVLVDANTSLYLIGGRQVFGPCRYLRF